MKISRLGMFVATLGLFLSLAFSSNVSALNIPDRPTDIPIVDQTGTLTETQKASLAQLISGEREKSGNQIAVLIIPSLEGRSLEEFSVSVAREWGIGIDQNDNGVLLLIAKNDRELRIEVGYGLEGALTDIQSGRIIQNEITPAFKNGQYYEGIYAGLNSIIAAIHNEYVASADDSGYYPFEMFLFPIGIVFMWFSSILARTKSWWLGGVVGGVLGVILGYLLSSLIVGIAATILLIAIGLLLDKAVSANYQTSLRAGHRPSWWAGGSSFGGGRSGGGGFGGFGGGGFGGGGSSGRW